MMPTALRAVSSACRTPRSLLLQVLCDPLQCLVLDARAPIHATFRSSLPISLSAFHTIPDRPEQAREKHNGSFASTPQLQQRPLCQQPSIRRDDIFEYVGPLQKAVGSLKVSLWHQWPIPR